MELFHIKRRWHISCAVRLVYEVLSVGQDVLDAFVGNLNSDLRFIISVYKYEIDPGNVTVDTEEAAGT